MRKRSASVGIATKEPGDGGPYCSDPMPAPVRLQAVAFTVPKHQCGIHKP